MQQTIPSTTDKDARTWGMICHLSAFVGFVIPLGTVLGPLVVWLIKKNEIPFVDDQGKEALNFQISVLIAFVICVLLMFIVIGVVLAFALAIYTIVMVIIAAIRANEGIAYRYPYALRLIK